MNDSQMGAKHHNLPWPEEAQERGILRFQHFRLGYLPGRAWGKPTLAGGRGKAPPAGRERRRPGPSRATRRAGGRPEEGRLPLASSLGARRLDS